MRAKAKSLHTRMSSTATTLTTASGPSPSRTTSTFGTRISEVRIFSNQDTAEDMDCHAYKVTKDMFVDTLKIDDH